MVPRKHCLSGKEKGKVIINQDHFVENIIPPDLGKISSNKNSWVLDDEFQTKYRSLVSKLNILSMSARPDISFEGRQDISFEGRQDYA